MKTTINESVIFSFLTTEMCLNSAGACGVLANIEKESSFCPDCYGDKGTSYGICQWHLSRFDRLKTFCSDNDLDYESLDGQLRYLKYELEKYYPKVMKAISEVDNTTEGAYSAGYYWCKHFEIPADTEKRSIERGNLASEYFSKYYVDSIVNAIENDNGETFVYTVKKGDTLSAIGKTYGVPYQDIANLNGILDPNYILPGQKLRIPNSGTQKSIEVLAREVIDGKWGNGKKRKNALTNAGYDYAAVQRRVNEILL